MRPGRLPWGGVVDTDARTRTWQPEGWAVVPGDAHEAAASGVKSRRGNGRSPSTLPRGRRRLLLLLAGVTAAGLMALGAVVLDFPDRTEPPIIANGSPTTLNPRPKKEAPTNAVQRVHRALHAIGRICQPGDPADRTGQVRPHVQTIVDFARTYPEVSVPLDDETGTTVSLLVVVRYSLRSCSPALAERVNQALPSRYQLPDPTG